MPDWLSAVVDRWVAVVPDLVGPAYPFVSAAHILSLALLVGSITVLDLRLLGAFRAAALGQIAPPLVRVAGVGLGGAIVTGVLLFSMQPAHYLANSAFLIKLALVVLGIVNAVLLRMMTRPSRMLWEDPVPLWVRFVAAVSLLTWVSAVLAGRWIAFL
jgi:hypothetical protein